MQCSYSFHSLYARGSISETGKVPTGIEDGTPRRPNDVAFSITYDHIDDFLRASPWIRQPEAKILVAYQARAHRCPLLVTLSA